MASKASDFTVEVRDGDFIRQGQIDHKFLDLMFVEVFRGVGSWQLKLPVEHPLLPLLKTPGSGLVVTDRSTGRVFSGRMQTAVLSQDATDPKGTWVISGVDDSVVAQATVVLPDPTSEPDEQSTAYWNIAGAGETVMKQAVRLNAADLAIAARDYPWLSAATDLARGETISVTVRFDVLGDFLTSAGLKSNLGWAFFQVDDGVVFDVFEPQDKTALIRLDVRNGGLESTELGWSAPTATQVLVLGQGEGADRTVLPVTTADSLAAAAAWGLRWEATKDQRNTDDPTELQQAGEEILVEQGVTINSLKVTPSDAPNQHLGTDWWLGDKVTVIIDESPTAAIVNQVATSITTAGVIRQAIVGDPIGFDWEAKVGNRLTKHETRISDLENAVEAGVTWDGIGGKPVGIFADAGDVKATARVTAPAGWVLADGTSYLVADYPELFDAIGYLYGGSGANFNVPNLKGRVITGRDPSDGAFDTLGETGGAKTHTLTASELPWANNMPSGSSDLNHVELASTASSSFGGGAHNNLQPYLVLNYIIKT